MEFTVPQFIEKEAKIVGPMTFKQFIFVGIAGAVCIFLYFTVPITTFIVAAIFILGVALSLAFLKIQKISLPILIKNLVMYVFGPKVYLWKMKIIPPKMIPMRRQETKTDILEKEETERKSSLDVSGKSHLKQLFTRLETKNK